MELRNRTTGEVVTDSQFRSQHPNTSFPKVLTAEVLDSFDYDPVFEGPQATLTPPYEISQRNGVELINGKWFTKYVVGPIFNSAQEEADYRAGKDASEAANIRTERNRLLSECDWTQLTDSPLDADSKLAWQLYRETLRMVPEQTGFPWNVEWPPIPGSN